MIFGIGVEVVMVAAVMAVLWRLHDRVATLERKIAREELEPPALVGEDSERWM